jgi:hypothetical protein
VEERMMTMHPEEGKQGVNIEMAKYVEIRAAILETLANHGEITFKGLTQEVLDRLEDSFEGSVSWYVTTVKLDLEARGVIERVAGSRPQRLRFPGQ